jgi:uncharacterized membrane protein
MSQSGRLLRTEILISSVLRGGVLICGSVIGLGLGMRFFGFGQAVHSSGEVIGTLLQGTATLDYQPPGVGADRVIAIGLLLLIALPITRVGLTVVLFIVERDWAFFLISAIVFSVLLSGIILGRAL